MLDAKRKSAIDSTVRGAFDLFRDAGEVGSGRDLVLALLLLKYLSDTQHQHATRAIDNPFVVPAGCDFYSLHAARHEPGNGARINSAFGALETRNAGFGGIFHALDFDATALGNTEQKNRLFSQLLHAFASGGALDFRGAHEVASEAVAFACDSLIRYVAAVVGKRGGEFFTPPEISELMARLMQPDAGESIGDPCCGSGSLLIACSEQARQRSGDRGCILYGQEKNGGTWALANINMLLHGQTEYQLVWGDTLREPMLRTPDNNLRRFDVVVSNPPFSLRDWGHEGAEHDAYQRYRRGVPPRAAGDYAFLSHMVETMNPERGRMVAVVSLGVLFRGGAERHIRERLIHENLIDAVIALPAKMLPHTGIPVALLVLRRNKTDEGVLFVDASGSYQHGKTQNLLRPEDMSRIEAAYQARKDDAQYARLVPRDEISASDFNLSVARYIGAVEESTALDLIALRNERAQLKTELTALEEKLSALLEEVSHG
jgi:type I restriction enzyme M protein